MNDKVSFCQGHFRVNLSFSQGHLRFREKVPTCRKAPYTDSGQRRAGGAGRFATHRFELSDDTFGNAAKEGALKVILRNGEPR
jgi:hypothetical protein